MKRRSISTMQRLKIFEAAKGICHICGLKITGSDWEVEHIRPLGLLGEDGGDNLQPAHTECHAPKTTADRARIDKAKRQAAKHVGAKRSRWPKSKFKRKVSGETVLRNP